jgi:tRNA-dihydrouridine synthase B
VTTVSHHPITLPHAVIPGNLFLAPLAGYTDRAFRTIAIEWGADFTFTEMISAEAVRRNNLKTLHLAEPAPLEKCFGIQLFSGTPEAAAAAVRTLLRFSPTLFDLNCGCSVPKIIKSGAGAILLKEPGKIGRMVTAMKEAGAPAVSVKLRLGWDASTHTYLEAADQAVAAGACLVTLHPRTRSQGFAGAADWSHITRLATHLPVPVIGSGDLYTALDGRRMLAETGCAGIMFARGAIGNPFIFRDTAELIDHHTPPPPRDEASVLQTALRHLELLADYKPELVAAREMRKHFSRYAKGLPAAAALRQEINSAETCAAYHRIITGYLNCHS